MLNQPQMRIVYIVLTAVSGPAVNILTRQFHMTPEDSKLWLDLLSAVTLAIGLGWGVSVTSTAGISQTVSQLPTSDRNDVVAGLTPAAKAHVLDSLPTSMKVASVARSPSVTKVVVKDNVEGRLQTMAADEEQPKVVTETEDKAR